MTAVVDMNPEQVEALGAITEMLVEVDRTISQLLAVREGLLAVGSRLSMDIGIAAIESAAPELTSSEAGDAIELAARAVAAEFATALRVGDRTVQRRMLDADLKVSQFPEVWRAQGAGRISAGQARVIVDAGLRLGDADRSAYAAQMIEHAQAADVSPSRLGRIANRSADRMQPRSLDDRHRDARKGRGVWMKDRADGMADFGIRGPAALVHAVFERLTALGVAVHDDRLTRAEAGDGRGLDEIRCDIALDMLLAGRPAAHGRDDDLFEQIRGTVSITVPATTLMGVDDAPAELDGRTPIDTATARRLAAQAPGWDRVITHPITGAVLAVDRYRPSAALRRWLRERDQRCRFPGCGYPARDCDIDHTEDAARGGQTDAANLADLCRRHHVLKHQTPWTVEQLGGGVLAWTSPTGQTYIDQPPPPNTITFAESDEPPPF